MAAILDSLFPLSRPTLPTRASTPFPSSPSCLSTLTAQTEECNGLESLILSSYIFSEIGLRDSGFAQPSVGFREYVDTFDGSSFKYPQCWIQVRGAGADIFFRDPYILDENLSVEFSSPSSSGYKTVEDLGPPQEAGKKVLKHYLIEFLSTRLGVRGESNVLSTSSRVPDYGKLYYQVEVNAKSFANSNELAVMPQVRVPDWNGTGDTFQFLELKTTGYMSCDYKTPESVFVKEENELQGSGGWLIGFLTLRFFLGMRFFFWFIFMRC